MKKIKLYFLVFSIISIILIIILFKTSNYKKYFINIPYNTTQTKNDFNMLKQIVQDKVQYIKKKSTFLQPYNKNIMNIIENNINNANDFNKLVSSFNLLPNNFLGTYPLTKLDNPIDSSCFQFEQGTTGWYWGYLTFSKQRINIMYYIIRIDLSCEDIRKKYNLKLGETTAYYIALGVGKDGDWHYSPYKYVYGSFESQTESAFKFQSLDTQILCTFQGIGPGNFYIEYSWIENNNKYGLKSEIYSKQKPYFNANQGCSPCIGTAGTLYWSYTQLYNKNTILTFNNNTFTLTDDSGIGWLDRQWLNGEINNISIECVNNIIQSTKITGGLGRYLWLNIHLDNIQYMISSFIDPHKIINKNDSYPIKYNIYSTSLEEPIYNKNSIITILDIVIIENTLFPTKYKLQLIDLDGNNHTYILDSTKFGNTVTIDLTGNLHWTGSAIVFDEKNNEIGTSFFEANQFQSFENYINTYFKNSNLEGANEYIDQKSNITFFQAFPSILLLLLYIIMIILWFYILIKYIIHNKKNNK